MADRYDLRILPTADRELRRVQPQAQTKLRRAISALASDPRPRGAKLLSAPEGDRIWRIRVGEYRVFYQVRDDHPVALVIPDRTPA